MKKLLSILLVLPLLFVSSCEEDIVETIEGCTLKVRVIIIVM